MNIPYSVFIYRPLIRPWFGNRRRFTSCLGWGLPTTQCQSRCTVNLDIRKSQDLWLCPSQHLGGTLCKDGKFDLILCNDSWRVTSCNLWSTFDNVVFYPETPSCWPKELVDSCGCSFFPVLSRFLISFDFIWFPMLSICVDWSFSGIKDCLYIPDLHRPLLNSISGSLATSGMALICFSFHRNPGKGVNWGPGISSIW